MALSFGYSLFDQAANSSRLAPFLFKNPQAIPQPDDFSVFRDPPPGTGLF
jgi:hypothetical protein